jgi:hypothetical protein
MKKRAIGVVVTGAALLGLCRIMHDGHKPCDHCRGSVACCHFDE